MKYGIKNLSLNIFRFGVVYLSKILLSFDYFRIFYLNQEKKNSHALAWLFSITLG
jgi:hypothetical protein